MSSFHKFLIQFYTLPKSYWHLNIVSVIEKISWWIMMIQMPIYIAQKDIPGGLAWSQSTKGMIFMLWALFQNTTPIFAGAIADKYGRKKTMIFATLLISTSYVLLANTTHLFSFTLACIILGIGNGFLKPALQGEIASKINHRNSSVAWGIYFLLINLSSFLIAIPLSKYMRDISWASVFYTSAVISLLNLITILTIKRRKSVKIEYTKVDLLSLIKGFFEPRIILFVLAISGFTITYMQFYETLPHYIYDWSDTSQLVTSLSLPSYMTMEIGGVQMLSYEYLYNINTGLTVILIILLSFITAKFLSLRVLIFSVAIASLGLFLTLSTQYGLFLVLGFVIYTFGEMISNPKINEYISNMAPKDSKSTFLGYLGFAWTIGLSGGAMIGAYLYGTLSEKANLAANYLLDKHQLTVSTELAFTKLMEIENLNHSQATKFLYDTYNPSSISYFFLAIGLFSLILLFFYYKKYQQSE